MLQGTVGLSGTLALQRFCNYSLVAKAGDTDVLWLWSDEKNRTNKRKHGLSFETARLVFTDVLALSRPDPHLGGDRWQTVGGVGPATLFVVHTEPGVDAATGTGVGRIISARKATSYERRAYEEGRF